MTCDIRKLQFDWIALIVTIIKSPGMAAVPEPTKTVGKDGITIGRGKNNHWILPDPDRYLSTRHAEIICENSIFYVVDRSTNGTFLNETSESIGKDNQRELKDGDRIIVGDYVLEVSASAANQESSESLNGINGPFAEQPVQPLPEPDQILDDPFDNPVAPLAVTPAIDYSMDEALLPDNEVLDPLEMINKSRAMPAGYDLNLSTQGDSADVLSHAMTLPEVIPDDWDSTPAFNDTAVVEPASVVQSDIALHQPIDMPAPSVAPVKEPQPVMLQQQNAGANKPEQVIPAAKSPPQTLSSDTADDLLEALGLNKADLSTQQLQQLNQVIGEFVRESIDGLIKVLGSRSSIKNEFRMSVTTIQSAENNPLKFSANVDDAIENMFVKSGKAYKDPVTSVKEGIETIADHQFSVLAGMRSAFNHLLERFNPELLEAKFDKQKNNNLLSSKKSRYWESYIENYKEIIKDRDDSFQYLFGDDFVQAYEKQMNKLRLARSDNK